MRAQGGSRETFGKQPGDARQNPYEFIKPSMTMIRNPTNLFGLQRWWSEAWWNHKILKIETSSKKAPYGPIKSNIIKICFTRSPYPFLNLNEIQTTPGPKKTNPGRKRGSRIEPTYVHVLWRKLLISLQKRAPTCVDTFFAGAPKKWRRCSPKNGNAMHTIHVDIVEISPKTTTFGARMLLHKVELNQETTAWWCLRTHMYTI